MSPAVMATRRTDSARADAEAMPAIASVAASNLGSARSLDLVCIILEPHTEAVAPCRKQLSRGGPNGEKDPGAARGSVRRRGHDDGRHVLEPALSLNEAFELWSKRSGIEVVHDEHAAPFRHDHLMH